MSSPYGRKMCKSKRLFICVGVYPVLLGRQVAVFAFLHCLLLTSHIENIKRIQYLTPKTQIDRQLGTIRYIKVNRERQREREAGSDQSALRLTFPPPPPPPPPCCTEAFRRDSFRSRSPRGDRRVLGECPPLLDLDESTPSFHGGVFIRPFRERVCVYLEGGRNFISLGIYARPRPSSPPIHSFHFFSFLFSPTLLV